MSKPTGPGLALPGRGHAVYPRSVGFSEGQRGVLFWRTRIHLVGYHPVLKAGVCGAGEDGGSDVGEVKLFGIGLPMVPESFVFIEIG